MDDDTDIQTDEMTPEQKLLAARRQAELSAPPGPVPPVAPPTSAQVPPLLPQQKLPPITQQAIPGVPAPPPAPPKPAYKDVGATIQNNLYMALRAGDKSAVKYFQQTMVDNERNKLQAQGMPFEQADFRAQTRFGSKPPPQFSLAPGSARFDASGRQIANVPKPAPAPTPFTLSPGATRYDPTGKPIVTQPPRPTQPRSGSDLANMSPSDLDKILAMPGVAEDTKKTVQAEMRRRLGLPPTPPTDESPSWLKTAWQNLVGNGAPPMKTPPGAPPSVTAPPVVPAPTPKAAAPAAAKEIVRVTKDGKRAVFDADTKQFIRYAD